MDFLALKNLWWILPLLILAIAAATWAYLQRKKAIALLTQGAEECHLKSNASPIRRRILAIVLLSSLILAALAALRPIGGTERTEFKRPAKNIVVLLDLSLSMTATDTDGISRSDAAKLILREFINARPTDKIGLISFAGDIYIESPVTLDRTLLLKRVNDVRPGDFLVPGTDITSALKEAQNLLTENPPPGSAIVVLSDGDNVTGDDPKEVLAQLKKSGVPVITVAFGKEGIPVNVPGTELSTQANYDTLKQLSNPTNGLFLKASPKDVDAQVARLSGRVDSIELNGENITAELFERPLDLYYWPLSLAILCLMIHLFLPLRTKSWHPLTSAITLLFLISQGLPAEEVDSYEEAIEVAKEEELPALIIFTGSDWSKLSITFEREILNHQVFKKWSDTKVIWTLIDLPRVGLSDSIRQERRELMKKLEVEAFPKAVFLNAKEEVIGALTHDTEGPGSWIKRANAIIAGKTEESDTAASVDFLPKEIRDSLEDETFTDIQRSIAYYNKALEYDMAEPVLSIKSKDRFKLLIDLYSKAAEIAPLNRPDLAFAARHKMALLHHRKGQSRFPKSEEELVQMATEEETQPVKLLKNAKRSFETALGIYKNAAPLKPDDENLTTNLALVYRNISRVTAYLDFLQAYQVAVEDTTAALTQEERFVKSLEREVNTRQEVNRLAIESSAKSIQELIAKSRAIENSPTILPAKGLENFRLAEEDIVLAPSPHRERELEQSAQHIQDALDHLIDSQQQQQGQGEGEGEEQGEGQGNGSGDGNSKGEEEDENEGGRQKDQENPQGDRPEGEDNGQEEPNGDGDGNEDTTEGDLKRAEKEGGDLRQRLLQKQQREYLEKGRRIPRSKRH